MMLLFSIVVDVTVVCLIALAAVAVLRRQSAALRHAVLTVAMVVAVLLPLLEIVLPPLSILHWETNAPSAASPATVPSATVVTDVTATAVHQVTRISPFSWGAWLLAVWAAGAVVILAKLLLGFAHLARLEARSRVRPDGRCRALADAIARSLGLRRRITILHSPDPVLLVTYGIRRPRILVPVDAETWSDEHLRMVLTHELVHVRRRDPATMVLVELVCALHWFNPLVWLCAARLRRESECACDDAVLRCGTDATRYATLLLSVARLTAARHRAWVTAPAIAHPSTLEGRIAAMLNRQRNRAPVTRLTKALVAIVACVIVIPLAAAGIAPSTSPDPVAAMGSGDVSLAPMAAVRMEPTRVTAAPATVSADRQPATALVSPAVTSELLERNRQQNEAARAAAAPAIAPAAVAGAAAQATGNIAGTAVDASGGVVPGVTVRLTEPTLGLAATTLTDGIGRFSFRDVSPGRYELALSIAGFATVNGVLSLDPGTTLTRIVTLPLGTVEETINVSCSPRAAHATPGAVARLGQWWARAVDVVVPALSAQDASPMRPVRVGGNIQAPRKVTDVRPVCPLTLVPATGATVRLVGRIGVDGLIHEVRRVEMVADVELPAALSDSALEAVRQWVFTPTLLNGQPVHTDISIRIAYRHM